MKNKKILVAVGIIFAFFIALILFFVIVLKNIQKDKKETINDMNYITDNYKVLSDNVTKYNKMRNDLISASKDLMLDNYVSVYENFTIFMSDYNNLIKDIDESVKNIDTKCGQKYPDNEVNNKCDYYKNMYEKIINLYVGDIKNYNNFIKSYNDYMHVEVPFIELIHGDYIDYDNDGVFEGVSNNE